MSLMVATAGFVALAFPQVVQEVRSRYVIGGADAGVNVLKRFSDGSFDSETSLKVAGLDVQSKLTGRVEQKMLVEFILTEKRGPQEYVIEAREAKLRVRIGERRTERDFASPTVFFANSHPCLSASIVNGYDQKAGGSQDLDVFLIEAASAIKCNATLKSAQSIRVNDQAKVVQIFSLRFATTVEMEIGITEDGIVPLWSVPSQLTKVIAAGYEELGADPASRYPELSQESHGIVTEKGLRAKMRDGTVLVSDVVRPEGKGRFPTILVRTPYGRQSSMLQGPWYAKRGYAFVVQDTRGRFESEGTFDPFTHERADGYDTLEWLTKLPWCDGNVGMIGGSYLGYVQWCAAVTRHPALKCIVPQVSPPDMFFNIPYDHGTFMLFGAIWWSAVVLDKNSVNVQLRGFANADKLATLPLSKVDDAVFGKSVPFYDAWLAKSTWNDFGSANFMRDLDKVRVPAFMVSGWWDGDGIGTKLIWERMRALGRKDMWLIYGPWTHFFNATTKLGDVDYGPDAVIDLDSLYLRWFDTWLKRKNVGMDKVSRVRIFLTGANEWREYSDWPPVNSEPRTLYLASQGPANGANSAGRLTAVRPPKGQEPDRYTYNPARAHIPEGEFDLTQASTIVKVTGEDEDVLVYRTDPLRATLDVCAPIELDLYFSTSAKDTDFFVSLLEEDGKGVMRAVGRSGKIRAQYLAGWNSPKLLTPGKTYRARIPLWDTAHRFQKGHRLAVLIRSSLFPSYARNLNTGEPIATATRMVAAHQTVFHDAERPSALRFRVLAPYERRDLSLR
jgi:putative CocE/NonD family hydrolase